MRFQQLCDPAAQASCALAVNDSNPRETTQHCVLEVSLHAARGLFDGTTNNIDLGPEKISGTRLPRDGARQPIRFWCGRPGFAGRRRQSLKRNSCLPDT
jgi:hypothetical protein